MVAAMFRRHVDFVEYLEYLENLEYLEYDAHAQMPFCVGGIVEMAHVL